MTLKDFLKNSNNVIETVKDHSDLMDFIIKIASFNNQYITYYKELRNSYHSEASTSHKRMTPIVDNIKNFDLSVLAEIRKFRPFDLVTQLQSLINGLKQTIIFGDELDEFLNNDIQKLIDLHTDAYSEKSFDEIFSFVSYCAPFFTKLNRYLYTAEVFMKNLELEPEIIPKENQVIEIQIISLQNSLENFYSFFSSIDDLYKHLCTAFVIHIDDYPLSIIKIESGSIWSKLFGHKHLVNLIKDLIFGIAGYFRDLQTGKIDREKFENQVKKADLVLDLIAKSKDLGVDPKNVVLLEKAFGDAVIDFTNSLPISTTEIFLDDEPLLKLNKKELKAIEGKQPLMLNSKNDNNEPSA